jgi:hypothetical protein
MIGIQPVGRFGQRPELSQATGITLLRCILGKFLGVGCHFFPSLFRSSKFRYQVPPCAREILAAEGGTVGENVVR